MDQKQIAREMLARRAGLQFLRGLNDLARKLPHPDGRAIRVTVEIIDQAGNPVEHLGTADIDTTNTSDLGFLASRRDVTVRTKAAATPPAPMVPTGKPNLRLMAGGA